VAVTVQPVLVLALARSSGVARAYSATNEPRYSEALMNHRSGVAMFSTSPNSSPWSRAAFGKILFGFDRDQQHRTEQSGRGRLPCRIDIH
jgi:hypothetical protein